jgi:hypothetical protein
MGLISLLAIAVVLAFSGSVRGESQPIMRDLELEALEEAVRWPNAQVPTIVALAGRCASMPVL